MNHDSNRPGYSAQVKLKLECGHHVIPLAQVAPDWIIPAEPRNLPPSPAQVVTDVDGREHRRSVFLSKGMTPNSIHVAIQPFDAAGAQPRATVA